MASLFDTLQAGAYRANIVPRTKKSRSWFQARVRELGDVSRRKIMSDDQLKVRSEPRVGDMCMYVYDPKLKAELPYYDKFPLTIMVQPAPGGFHGLNLHYLHPNIRAQFLDNLYDLRTNDKWDLTTKMQLEYQLLKGSSRLRYFKPCFKHYLTKHIQGQFLLVEPADWEIAIFLPTESFRKQGKTSVWSQSGVA